MPITAAEILKILRKEGFVERSGKGSHLILTHADGRRTVVSKHRGDLPKPTVRQIEKQTGVKLLK